ncbi:MAG: hypothetical protein WA919_02270 [Coleofasciculaceae cyanobacterium]
MTDSEETPTQRSSDAQKEQPILRRGDEPVVVCKASTDGWRQTTDAQTRGRTESLSIISCLTEY